MNTLQCPNCGGEMESIAEGHYRCRYCKKESYVKSTNSELMFALNMGAKLRYRKDFAGAMEEYERAIALDNACAEAHWGMFLAEYGIEFVKDQVDNEYKPTLCHRVQNIAVKDNLNFNNAIKYATPSESAEYKKLGESIEKVRKQLLSMSGKMQSYDIFICYKQNEEDGKTPTEESKWARDLYYKLTGYGYNVFYAEESLADKAGAYEANIFSALNSAKVMLILGTSLEHINAVWVKNEWSRFVNLVKDNPIKSFKTILGANVAPETLPTALRVEQAIRHDDMDWWDKVRSFLKTAFDNEGNSENVAKVNVSDVAKKRFEEFEQMREQARTAREKLNANVTPEQLIADKKKRDLFKKVEEHYVKVSRLSLENTYAYFIHNRCSFRPSSYYSSIEEKEKREFDSLLCDRYTIIKELKTYAPTDFQAARIGLLMWTEDCLKRRIYDESQLMDYAFVFNCDWIEYVFKNCNEAEKQYYNKIISICSENQQAEDKLSPIKNMIEEGMYDEALPFAKNLACEYPTYQWCWHAVLCCKCKAQLNNDNVGDYYDQIINMEEFHNLEKGIYDTRNQIDYLRAGVVSRGVIKCIREDVQARSVLKENTTKCIILITMHLIFLAMWIIGMLMMILDAKYTSIAVGSTLIAVSFVSSSIVHFVGNRHFVNMEIIKEYKVMDTMDILSGALLTLPLILATYLIVFGNGIVPIIRFKIIEKRIKRELEQQKSQESICADIEKTKSSIDNLTNIVGDNVKKELLELNTVLDELVECLQNNKKKIPWI